MLGVTYIYIKCDKFSCKYNKEGRCWPPKNSEGDEQVELIHGTCRTYKSKPECRLKKKA